MHVCCMSLSSGTFKVLVQRLQSFLHFVIKKKMLEKRYRINETDT